MRPPVFISAPFRGDDREILVNVRRACLLANHAVHLGFTPFVPHANGWSAVYGPNTGADERALDCCAAMVHHLAGIDGAQCWVILRDDLTPSPGTAIELEEWDGASPICRTWTGWLSEIAARESA